MFTILAGQQPDRCQVVGAILWRGMAGVYRGIHASIGHEVAIKVLLADFLQGGSFHQRCNWEIKNNAGLAHPHVLFAHHFGEQDDLSYIITTPVHSTRARCIQRRSEMLLGDVVRPVHRMSWPFDHARENSIVCREVRPSSIRLDEQPNVNLSGFCTALLDGACALLGAWVGALAVSFHLWINALAVSLQPAARSRIPAT